ncbi:MAG: DUF3149 domain-containing protein [Rhodocyclaceae bacterium]|nr:DUF3149 domain-containing protein [Rhodocyclaceae bacterium]
MVDLLMSDIGLLSLFTIGFVIVMGVYLTRFISQNMDKDAAAARRREREERA